MFDGLWIIEFRSSLGLFGRGVIVLNKGRILGGDLGYYYSGRYIITGEKISGEADVIRFDQNSVSVFGGDIGNYSLSFKGKIDENTFEMDATSESFPDLVMKIKAIKKENL